MVNTLYFRGGDMEENGKKELKAIGLFLSALASVIGLVSLLA